MIEAVSGSGSISGGKDWAQVWIDSQQCEKLSQEIDNLVSDTAAKPPSTVHDGHAFASPMWTQSQARNKTMLSAHYKTMTVSSCANQLT
jgi:hypothetical protein